MIRQIGAIGIVTFHELLREKVLWSSFVFALLSIGLAYSVSQLSFVDNARIALDFGLAAIAIIGGLLSVVMGATLIAKEVQNRTLYLVVTKAIWRWQFVIGRFLGLFGIITLNSLIMTVVFMAIYLIVGGKVEASILQCLLLLLVEFAVLASAACVFSALSTTTLAAIFTSGIWVIGHAMGDLKILSLKMEPEAIRPVVQFIAKVLPDLTRFDIKAEVAHKLYVSWGSTIFSTAYGFAYIAFALTAACLIFQRRDL